MGRERTRSSRTRLESVIRLVSLEREIHILEKYAEQSPATKVATSSGHHLSIDRCEERTEK